MKNCPFCAEEIQDDAVKCKHCGEWLDENFKSNTTPAANTQIIVQSKKNKGTAALLAIFLGGIGIHKFYLNQAGWGIVYILFCFTFIPAILGLIEGLMFAMMSDQEFDSKYNHIHYIQTSVRQDKLLAEKSVSLSSENKSEVKSEGMSNRTLGWLIIAGIVFGFIVLSPMCDNSKAVYKKSGTNNSTQQPYLDTRESDTKKSILSKSD